MEVQDPWAEEARAPTLRDRAVLAYRGAKLHAQRLLRRHELSLVIDRLAGLRASRRVLVSTIRNDAERVPYFLRYYRELGIEHFVVLDNMSTDNLREILAAEPDVTVFEARGGYRRSRYGLDWVNAVLSAHCSGKWCLHVDTDEFLVFPGMERSGLEGLVDRLDAAGRPALNCVMIDMYSDRPVSRNHCGIGEPPLAVCNLFDADGYERRFDPLFRMVWIKGGVRGRLFFRDIWQGPALNKTPLVRWKRHYAFVHSTHQLWPPSAHGSPEEDADAPTGALLHFKFLAQFTGKLTEEAGRRQHTGEYGLYAGAMADDFAIAPAPCTTVFGSVRDLERAGLVRAGAPADRWRGGRVPSAWWDAAPDRRGVGEAGPATGTARRQRDAGRTGALGSMVAGDGKEGHHGR